MAMNSDGDIAAGSRPPFDMVNGSSFQTCAPTGTSHVRGGGRTDRRHQRAKRKLDYRRGYSRVL